MSKQTDLNACNQLAQIAAPYTPPTQESEALFQAAMTEMDAWHKAKNPHYASMCSGDVRPVIPVGLFKQLDLATPVEDAGIWLTSSGTSKTSATQVFFDQPSMARIEKSMLGIFLANGMFAQQASRFLLLSPDPRQGKFPGYATSFFKYTAAAPVKELVFAVDEQGTFQAQLAINTLKKWADDDAPIFIFGLTVFFEQLMLAMEDSIQFEGVIKGITGGGWKGLTKTMDRTDIQNQLLQKLQAPQVDIRDIFGMTEHPVHYLSCQHGHFHIPQYSRLFIMDEHGKALPEGEVGLIRLQNPFYAALPAHDLLTEDSGSWGTTCTCGNPMPYLKYHGRISSTEGICADKAVK